MKKFLSVALIAVSIALCCAFVGCGGGKATVNYTLSEDGTYYILSSVTGNVNSLTKYDVPATYTTKDGGEHPVGAIADEAFYHCLSLTKVTISDTVKTIGNRAFAMSGITAVEIPQGVETIGNAAFAYCPYLETVSIPASVTSLGSGAFASCSKLKRAEIYASVTELKNETFYNSFISSGGNVYPNTSLKEVVLSSTITKIENTAFAGNAIADIYFMGSQEQWDALYFYSTEKNDKGEYAEKKLKKDDYIPSSTKVHVDYLPE